MPAFTVKHATRDREPYQVFAPDGAPAISINEYLAYLVMCGRSAYTQRAYAIGLAHFFSWLDDTGVTEDAVTRHQVSQYIAVFGSSRKAGACKPAGHPVAATPHRKPRTLDHRLSVLAAYFAYRIQHDDAQDAGTWRRRSNPVSPATFGTSAQHGMAGRDAPPRGRAGEFRRRVPHQVPQQLEPALIERLIAAAGSYRDQAILTLLARTGQRIGDWSPVAGRHGLLGMALTDLDVRRRTITVRLKGARDEHRVPVTDDFWPLWDHYLANERPATAPAAAAWISLRKGKGKPLSDAAFESALRYCAHKLGTPVHAHLFRHTFAQAVLDTTGNLAVAQALLGHAHVSTTADLYTRVDHQALVAAVAAVKTKIDAATAAPQLPDATTDRYAFAYDAATLRELDQAAAR